MESDSSFNNQNRVTSDSISSPSSSIPTSFHPLQHSNNYNNIRLSSHPSNIQSYRSLADSLAERESQLVDAVHIGQQLLHRNMELHDEMDHRRQSAERSTEMKIMLAKKEEELQRLTTENSSLLQRLHSLQEQYTAAAHRLSQDQGRNEQLRSECHTLSFQMERLSSLKDRAMGLLLEVDAYREQLHLAKACSPAPSPRTTSTPVSQDSPSPSRRWFSGSPKHGPYDKEEEEEEEEKEKESATVARHSRMWNKRKRRRRNPPRLHCRKDGEAQTPLMMTTSPVPDNQYHRHYYYYYHRRRHHRHHRHHHHHHPRDSHTSGNPSSPHPYIQETTPHPYPGPHHDGIPHAVPIPETEQDSGGGRYDPRPLECPAEEEEEDLSVPATPSNTPRHRPFSMDGISFVPSPLHAAPPPPSSSSSSPSSPPPLLSSFSGERHDYGSLSLENDRMGDTGYEGTEDEDEDEDGRPCSPKEGVLRLIGRVLERAYRMVVKGVMTVLAMVLVCLMYEQEQEQEEEEESRRRWIRVSPRDMDQALVR